MFLTNKLKKSEHYKIREKSIFLNDADHKHFLKNGWFVAKNVVEPNDIKTFEEAQIELVKFNDYEIKDVLVNVGCAPCVEMRDFVNNVIHNLQKDIFPRVFKEESIQIKTGGTYIVKPPHNNSILGAHQDAATVDEEKEYSLFAWIPLVDMTPENGPILVLPGSHLWGNTQRGFGVPWPFSKHNDFLLKHMKPVLLKKGDMLVFDPALIHASPPNYTKENRTAILISIVQKNPQLIYFYENSALEKGLLEKYYVDETFFADYDFMSKPNEEIWEKEIVSIKNFNLSEKEVLDLIKKHEPSSFF